MPCRKYEIVWTEHALDRLSKRGFKKADVQCATNGQTLENSGRLVFMVLDRIKDRIFEIVSIRETTTSEKQLYRKKVG